MGEDVQEEVARAAEGVELVAFGSLDDSVEGSGGASVGLGTGE